MPVDHSGRVGWEGQLSQLRELLETDPAAGLDSLRGFVLLPTGVLLTAQQVARLLNVHVNTVKRLADRGELEFFRVCKRGDRRFPLAAVLDYLERMTNERS